jgi:hypothetical protein
MEVFKQQELPGWSCRRHSKQWVAQGVKQTHLFMLDGTVSQGISSSGSSWVTTGVFTPTDPITCSISTGGEIVFSKSHSEIVASKMLPLKEKKCSPLNPPELYPMPWHEPELTETKYQQRKVNKICRTWWLLTFIQTHMDNTSGQHLQFLTIMSLANWLHPIGKRITQHFWLAPRIVQFATGGMGT